jgi:hypothetical protein
VLYAFILYGFLGFIEMLHASNIICVDIWVFVEFFYDVWLSLFREHYQHLSLLDVAERVYILIVLLSHIVVIILFLVCCDYVEEKFDFLYGLF